MMEGGELLLCPVVVVDLVEIKSPVGVAANLHKRAVGIVIDIETGFIGAGDHVACHFEAPGSV